MGSGIRSVQFQTNESKIRLVALFVLCLTGLYLLTRSPLVLLLLVIDFALRSFDLGRLSLLARLSDWLVTILKLPFKPVYLPPKRFAARMGLVCCLMILLMHVAGLDTLIMTCLVACFAALESFFSICAGCYVFSYLQRFKKQDS